MMLIFPLRLIVPSQGYHYKTFSSNTCYLIWFLNFTKHFPSTCVISLDKLTKSVSDIATYFVEGTESEMRVELRQDRMNWELPNRQALLPEGQRRARPAAGGLESVTCDLSLMPAATWSPQLPPPQNKLPGRSLLALKSYGPKTPEVWRDGELPGLKSNFLFSLISS